MHYEPHGIQPEGRAVEESAKTGIESGERGQSESGKSNGKRRGHRECKCIRCGSVFKTHKSKAETPKYCSTHCARAGFPQWRQCSGCHAMIGFGTKKSAQILGCVTHSVVWDHWNKTGIERFVPDGRSWANQKKEPWWGDCAADWMYEYRARFFDWSGIWRSEQSSRKSKAYYGQLSAAEKKDRNHRNRIACLESRKESYRKWTKHKRATDPAWKIAQSMRARLTSIVKGANMGSMRNFIGCDIGQLRRHLEAQFSKRMNWENHGTYWQVDHILPVASFDHSDRRQILQCWHWSNLAPLEAKKNLAKSDQITKPQMHLLLECHA